MRDRDRPVCRGRIRADDDSDGSAPEFTDIIDRARPVAVSPVALPHFVVDDPAGVVGRSMDAVPSGSWLIVSRGADDVDRYHPG